MHLVWPAAEHLASYVHALERGWSPDTQRAAAAHDELARIAADPTGFVAEQVDREGRGPPVVLPDVGREGPPCVELTTDASNVASRRVTEANGGTLVEEFVKPAALGGTPGLRFRIALA